MLIWENYYLGNWKLFLEIWTILVKLNVLLEQWLRWKVGRWKKGQRKNPQQALLYLLMFSFSKPSSNVHYVPGTETKWCTWPCGDPHKGNRNNYNKPS